MKKNRLFWLCIIAFMANWQANAQDIVRVGDPWYLFKEYKLRGGFCGALIGLQNYYSGGEYHVSEQFPLLSQFALNHYILSNYTLNSVFQVYGVAFVSKRMSSYDNAQPCVLLSNRKGTWVLGDTTFALDTATFAQCIKQCKFSVEIDGSPDTDTSIFYEYYFNHPWPASTLADTFYVGVYMTTESSINYLSDCPEYGYFLVDGWAISYTESYDNTRGWFLSSRYPPDDPEYSGYYYNGCNYNWTWLGIFPIVGLRCVAPKASLVERADGMVTVRWTQAEAGMEYQVAYGPYNVLPDSATVLTLTDTFCTVPEMTTGGVQGVWVRKSCRYLTSGYDTTVWSDWSQPVLFRTEAVGMEQVYRDGVHIGVREGMIAVEDECGELPEVRVYDMLGRCLWHRAGGRSQQVAVPAGVYAVRVGDNPARKVTVLAR